MPDPDFYSDVHDKGGLVNAVQDALGSIYSSLRARGLGSEAEIPNPQHFPEYARVERGDRFFQVYMAAQERLFLFDFWDRGVCLAHGKHSSLEEIAAAVHAWIENELTTGQMEARFPFFKPEEKAAAFEAGKEVEWAWKRIRDREPKLFVSFIDLVLKEPRLAQLFPVVSIYTLSFSKCTGYPYATISPNVTAQRDGTFDVRDSEGHLLGTGDAAAAVALVLKRLPQDIGSAVKGTSADL